MGMGGISRFMQQQQATANAVRPQRPGLMPRPANPPMRPNIRFGGPPPQQRQYTPNPFARQAPPPQGGGGMMVPGGTPNFNMRPEGGIMNSGANLNAGAHVFGAEGPQPQQEMNPQMMARIQAVRGGMIR